MENSFIVKELRLMSLFYLGSKVFETFKVVQISWNLKKSNEPISKIHTPFYQVDPCRPAWLVQVSALEEYI